MTTKEKATVSSSSVAADVNDYFASRDPGLSFAQTH